MKSLYSYLILFTGLASISTASEKLLDYWDETIRLFGAGDTKHSIDRFAQKSGHKKVTAFQYDLSDKVCGDFSVRYAPAQSQSSARFGFMTQLWKNWFKLDSNFNLEFQMKVEDPSVQDSWQVQIVDAQNRVATTTLDGANTQGHWQAFAISLSQFKRPADFDLNSIKLVQFEAGNFSPNAVVKFDKIAFSKGKQYFGITDKTVDQRIREAEATKRLRTDLSMQKSSKHKWPLMKAFALLYLNKNLEQADQFLNEGLDKALTQHHWDLFQNSMMCRIYYYFSNRAGIHKGRMSADTEKRLLEVLWERTYVKNDIHWARQSTWYLDGSENHDLSAKASCLVSSRIFMHEPDYKDRIYPDYGFGGGYFYGHSGYLRTHPVESRIHASGGRANLKDGKEYKAQDHYEAWLEFFKDYFPERAKHGFFVENYSNVYSKHSWNMIELIRSFSGDDTLTRILNDFADLYWAAWVQAAPGGILGGPKTRHHSAPGGYGSNAGMITNKLGSLGAHGVWGYWNALSSYKLPRVVWKMALDREGMGTFIYQSRGIGEDVNKLPRPPGTERSLVIEPNSRFLKYVYVTPQYTLGTQMDYPLAAHSHLSTAGRWHGMTVTSDAKARIVPVGIGITPNYQKLGSTIDGKLYMEVMYKTAQHENTLIFQRTENFLTINPDWFPSMSHRRSKQGVYIGKAWDTVQEDAGWIFMQKGHVYAGVRPVLRDVEFEKAKMGQIRTFQRPHDDATVKMDETCYSWNEDKSILLLQDDFMPVIIQSGDQASFGSFSNFIQSVKNAQLELYNTVVQEFDELVYTPPGQDAPEMIFNAANMEIPRIGGEYIDYEYPMTFDSPFIQSKYGSGKIRIQYHGEKLDLDFSKSAGWKFWR